jgi:hypothetical protein
MSRTQLSHALPFVPSIRATGYIELFSLLAHVQNLGQPNGFNAASRRVR